MKKIILIVLAVLCLTAISCRTKKELTNSETTTKIKDSISRKVEIIDTAIVVRPADTAKISAIYDNLTSTPIIQRSKTVTAKLWREGNTVKVECIEDELREVIQIQKETIEYYHSIMTEQNNTITLLKKEIPALLKPLVWIGGGVIALLVISIILKFINPKKV